jgi:hypothetical protein
MTRKTVTVFGATGTAASAVNSSISIVRLPVHELPNCSIAGRLLA